MKDFSSYENSDRPLADEGEYELVLKIERGQTKDGNKDYLNLDFKIRNDVDQKHKDDNIHIFDKAWRDTTDPEWYDCKKLGKILYTQKNKKDFKAGFDEQDELTQYLNGIHLVAYIEKKYDDYYQREVNSIKYLSYKPSAWDVAHPEAAAKPVEDAPVTNEAADKLVDGAGTDDPCPF